MLEALRRGTGSWVVKGLLGLLVVSFAIWGIGRDTFSNIGGNNVATVGELEISPNEFSDEYQREIRRLSAQFGGQIDSERARQLGLPEAVLQRLITRALYDQGVADFSLAIPDSVVAADIRSNPAFKDDRGNFDRFQYEGVLRNAGMSPAYYEFLTRRDMLREQLLGAMTDGAVTPKTQAAAVFRYRNEKRVAELVIIENSSINDIPAPDEAALAKHHQDNKPRYTAPEYRSLTWVVLAPEDLADDMAVTDDQIAEEYENRLDEFTVLERRDLDQLLYAEESQAQAAHKRLSEGADFNEVAKDKENIQGDNTALGPRLKSDLPEETREAAFAADKNAVTAPVQSLFGWHIYRVNDIQAGSTKTLEDVRADLRRDLQLNGAADSLYDLSAKLEDELAGGASLDDAAQRFALKVRTARTVDAQGLDENGKAVDVPKLQEFLSTAFATEEGAEPILSETQSGSYFIVRVDGIKAPALKPLDKVREAVTADWNAAQRSNAAAKKAETMIEKLKGGADLSTQAEEIGVEMTTTKDMTRFSTAGENGVSHTLLANLFKLKVGEFTDAPNPTGTAHVVARLKTVTAANPQAAEADLKALTRQLRSGVHADLLAQYRTALQAQHEVVVNRNLLEQLY